MEPVNESESPFNILLQNHVMPFFSKNLGFEAGCR